MHVALDAGCILSELPEAASALVGWVWHRARDIGVGKAGIVEKCVLVRGKSQVRRRGG